MRFAGIAATTLALAASFAPDASAAMCIRLFTQPPTLTAGSQTQVGLRTYAPYSHGLRPWRVTNYRFRVEAVAPTGRVFRVRILPERANRWVGSFWFPMRGVWTIRVTNFAPRYTKGCGEVLRMRVARRR